MDRPALFYGQAWHLPWSCWALRRRVCPGRERRLCRQIYKQPFLRAGEESPELRGSSEGFILAKATSQGPRAHYKMLPRGVCVALSACGVLAPGLCWPSCGAPFILMPWEEQGCVTSLNSTSVSRMTPGKVTQHLGHSLEQADEQTKTRK